MSWWERQLRNYLKGAVSVDESTLADGDILSYDSTNQQWSNSGGWTSYTPTLSASGSMTYTASGGGISLARRCRVGNLAFYSFSIEGTTGGTASTRLIISLQDTPANDNLAGVPILNRDATSGALVSTRGILRSSGTIEIYKPDSTNYGLGTGRLVFGNFFFEVA